MFSRSSVSGLIQKTHQLPKACHQFQIIQPETFFFFFVKHSVHNKIGRRWMASYTHFFITNLKSPGNPAGWAGKLSSRQTLLKVIFLRYEKLIYV